MLFANANNTSDRGFGGGGPGRGFGGANGLNASKMIAANYNYELKDKFKFNTSLRWNHSDGDIWSRRSSENFMGSSSSFSNSLTQNFSRSNSWNGNIRLEWMPDSMTNILFRPSISWSTSDGLSGSQSASYNKDPYTITTKDPLSEEGIDELEKAEAMVNSQLTNGITYSDNNNISGMLQVNRKLGNKGRNITFRVDAKYTDNDSKSISLNNAKLYLVQTAEGKDSTYQTNRYNLTPSKNYSYAGQLTYSEPLWKATFLQFSYKFTYSYSKSDRSTYDFSKYAMNGNHEYRGWDSYLNPFVGQLDNYRNDELSRFSEYRNYNHDIQVMMRFVRQKYNLNFGVMIQPQQSKYIQDYQGVHVDTVRNVVNVSRTFDFRYRFSKMSNLRVN